MTGIQTRALPTLRRAFLTLLFGLLAVAPVARAGDVAPDRPSDERPAVRALPLASVADAPSATVDVPTAPMMPLERSIRSLDALKRTLQSGDVAAQTVAAHKVTVLAMEKNSTEHLQPLRPALKDLLYTYSAPAETRLMALAALYSIAPDRTLRSVQYHLPGETSPKVRHVMETIIVAEANWATKGKQPRWFSPYTG